MIRGAVAVIGMVGLFLLVMHRVALPHNAPRGWQYDAECCSDRDCAPIDYAPKPLPGGSFLLPTGEVVERGRVKWSRDEHYHLCRSPNTGQIYCLYVPPQGS
jgi:hypothetical protein